MKRLSYSFVKWVSILISLVLSPGPAASQQPASISTPPIDTATYEFLGYARNRIGRATALDSFFHHLALLEAGATKRINIVHIGDSHIQADFWSGRLRGLLQERFGNAGRGLVFPYPLAGTNCPLDLNFSSNIPWTSRKNVFRREGPPLGISGISIRSTTPSSSVSIRILDRYHYGQDYRFDRITVFHDAGHFFQPRFPESHATISAMSPAGAKYYEVRTGDTLYELARSYGCSIADLQQWNQLSGHQINTGQRLIIRAFPAPDSTVTELPPTVKKENLSSQHTQYTLPQTTTSLTLRSLETKNSLPILFGLVLEQSRSPGILYHSIGVNGATYYHYNRATYFSTQLTALRPNLIIISLGTNEALASSIEEDNFRQEVQHLVDQLREITPGAAILLTTNPDVLRKKRYDNPANRTVRKVIMEVASQKQLGFWDLHSVMGGPGAIRSWQKAGLAHTDFIHFTKEGYWLQAQLLYQTLMNAYEARN